MTTDPLFLILLWLTVNIVYFLYLILRGAASITALGVSASVGFFIIVIAMFCYGFLPWLIPSLNSSYLKGALFVSFIILTFEIVEFFLRRHKGVS